MGGHYSALMLEKKDGKMLLQQWSGIWNEGEESHEYLEEITKDQLCIRMTVKETRIVSYQISEEGKEFRKVGRNEVVTPGKWVGVKTGLGAVQDVYKRQALVRRTTGDAPVSQAWVR